jgi:peptidoglycan/xylan/chitin deacetylase (PgdA/CDA1 family)
MHSTRQATVEALPHIIEALQDLGYSFVTLGEALN